MILHNDIWGDTSVTLIEEIGVLKDYGDGSCFLTINRKNRKRCVLRG